MINKEETSEFFKNSEVFLVKECIREKPEDDEDSGAKRLFPDRQARLYKKALTSAIPNWGTICT